VRPLPVLTLTLAMLLWSSSFIALKHVLEIWSFGQVLFMRMGVASCCWLLCYRQLGRVTYQKGDWRWLALMGALEPCLYFLLEVNALRYTSAGQAGMVCALLPLMVALVAFVLLGERVSRRQLLGFAIAIVGIALLGLGEGADEFAPNALLGNSLEMGAMLCAATYSVVFKKLSSRYGVMTLTALQAFVGTLFFAPFAFSAPWPASWAWQDMGVILCRKALQQPACRHRDRLGLIPQGGKGIKVRQLAKDHLHGVLHSGGQPSVRSKNDSVHTHPRPFLWFLHLFGVCIVLFVIDVIIIMYIVPHFAQTSRGFSKKIFTLVKCTKHFPYILAVSPITFRRTIKRASFPHGKDALFRELIGA
jgi:drug/metabolite transporter (DMT)-like permease